MASGFARGSKSANRLNQADMSGLPPDLSLNAWDLPESCLLVADGDAPMAALEGTDDDDDVSGVGWFPCWAGDRCAGPSKLGPDDGF